MSNKTTPDRAVGMIYVTCGSVNEAREIGDAVVRERLAACANIIDPMTSIYRWEGEIQEGTETVLIVKTTADQVPALTDRVAALHSYDCPCIVGLPVDGGNQAFLDWIAGEISV